MTKKELLKIIKAVSLVTIKRSTLSVCRKIRITNGNIFRATDLEQWITVTKPGGGPEFDVVVDAVELKAVVKALPGGEVDLSAGDGRLHVGPFTIQTSLATDFPPAPTKKVIHNRTVDATTFSEALKKVAFGASTDDTRPSLCGIFWAEGALVATDGRRLVRCTLPSGDIRVILSPACAKIFPVLFPDGTARVEVSEGFITFTDATTCYTSKQVDGPYPEYKKVLPQEHKTTATFNKSQFKEEVKRAAVSANVVVLNFTDKLDISTLVEGKEYAGTMVATVIGAPLRIGFNAKYLLEILDRCVGETIELRMASPLRGMIIIPQDGDDMYLQMPVEIE